MPTNYPGSVDSFSTKIPHVSPNAAADVNNLQDAVVAIETAVPRKASPDVITGAWAHQGNETHSGIETFSGGLTTGAGGGLPGDTTIPVPAATIAGPIWDWGGSSYNVHGAGAKGDGVTDDTDSIDDTAEQSPYQMEFGPGNFVYNGTGISNALWHCKGAGKEATTVTLGASSWFYNRSGVINQLLIEGISFTGGLGAIRQSNVGADSATLRTISQCNFLAYTQAAISDIGTDTPYWKIDHCFFQAANATGTIGVAISGSPEGLTIADCAFWVNRVHVKIAGGRGTNILNTEFLYVNSAANPRMAIWIVPSPAGTAGSCRITGVKFGGEGKVIGDYTIVAADEDATGADFSTHMPALGAASSQVLSQLLVLNAFYVPLPGGADLGPPLLFSTTNDMRGCKIHNLQLGGAPRSIVETLQQTSGGFEGLNVLDSVLSTTNWGWPAGRDPIKNCRASWFLIDPHQLFEGCSTYTHYMGGGSDVGYVNLTPLIGAMTFFNASAVSATDSHGGSDALEVTIGGSPTSLNGLVDSLGLPAVGVPIWVEFDLKQGSSSPLNIVSMAFGQNPGQNLVKTHLPTANWVRYRYRTMTDFTGSPGHYIFFGWPLNGTIPSPSGTKFQIGRIRVYHAREPLPSDLALPFVGSGIRVAEGTNAKQGTVTLVAGVKVVTNTAVTANSRILLTAQSLGTVAAPKALAVTARTAGTSFTITSADATDTSVVAWEIFEPA